VDIRGGFQNRFTTRDKFKFNKTVVTVAEWWATICATNNLVVIRQYQIKDIFATSSKIDELQVATTRHKIEDTCADMISW